MSDEEHKESNRRESFRIEDTVTLKVRMLNEESLTAITDDFNGFRMRYGIKSHLQNQKDVRKPKLIRIKKTNPDVAEYLASLEDQIGQLAERLDQDRDSSGDAVKFNARADLSATGIRFRTALPLEVGNTIEIGLVLSTQNTEVVMLGAVLRVEERPEQMVAASIHYSHIHPEDTEAIIRHLARLQQLELQARRGVGQ